jgi:hypothetical protein
MAPLITDAGGGARPASNGNYGNDSFWNSVHAVSTILSVP